MARQRPRKPRVPAVAHRPGAAPGVFELPDGIQGALRGFRFDATRCSPFVIETPMDVHALHASLKEDEVVWLDLCGLDRSLIDAIAAAFRLHPLAVEDAVHAHQRSKLEAYPDHDLIIARTVALVDGHPISDQMSFFVGASFVVTIQEVPGDPFDPVRERLTSEDPTLLAGGVGKLLHALVDAVVDDYFPLISSVGDRIEDLEETVLEAPKDENLAEIQRLRRTIITFRRAAWQLREALQGLVRGDLHIIRPEARVYFRDTLDHIIRIVDVIESYRDLIGGLMELHMSAVSLRMNQVVQVLTVISSIFIPLTFIVGIYGMNFDTSASDLNMPELRSPYGYPAVMLGMTGLAGGLLLIFWRLGWLGVRRSGPTVLSGQAREQTPPKDR
jgi:magnesium transporter